MSIIDIVGDRKYKEGDWVSFTHHNIKLAPLTYNIEIKDNCNE